MKKNRKNSQKSTFSPKFSEINKCWFFSKIPLQFFDFTPKVSLVWFWYSYDNFWWFYENLKKYFFYQKKTIFFKKSIFFSKTSIMEDLYIDVETWILHQFRRLYPQNFRFYTYFLNFMKKNWLCLFPRFLWYYLHMQYSKNDVLYAYSKIFMGNRQTKIFFVKT